MPEFAGLLADDVSPAARAVVARWNDGKFVKLGRSDEADIQVDDEKVSRKHLKISLVKNGFQKSEQIVVALRDRGFPVEYLLAPDEGHGFARPINNLVLFTSAVSIQQRVGGDLAQILKGISYTIRERLRVRGEMKVLTNVQVLCEGFDEPLVDCVIMARPTQSRALYVQALGRGLRLAEAGRAPLRRTRA